MDLSNFWKLLSKHVENIGEVPKVDKLSKLFENDSVKKFLPSNADATAILKLVDEVSETFFNESLAARKDVQLHKLNKYLLERVFILADSISSFDLFFYSLLYTWMSALSDKERFIFLNITRWFDFIQNQSTVKDVQPLIVISQNPPPVEPKKDDKKPSAASDDKKANEKKDDKKKDTTTTTTAATTADAKKQTESAPKKEKKQAQPVKKEEPKPEDISRFEIRVGKIVDCKKHENADSLYVENIDLGEEKPRQIVSGLVKFIPLDKMIGSRVLVLCNLKPSNLKSVRSEGMVLCASNAEHTVVEFVQPPTDAKIGERVVCEKFPGEPDKVLKSEIVSAVLGDLKSNDNKIATYKGDEWKTSSGSCFCATLSNAPIK